MVGTQGVHQLPGRDPYSLLVYASRPTDVLATIVDGRVRFVILTLALFWSEC